MQHHATVVLVDDIQSHPVTVAATEESIDLHWPQLGVAEARELSTRAYMRPSEQQLQVLIVRSNFITHEAQNALLKLLEEPPASTRFIFVLVRDFQFLPTLRSRVVIEELLEVKAQNDSWQTFAAAPRADRMQLIADSAKAKDVDWQRAVKAGLLEFLRNSSSPATLDPATKTRLNFVATKLLTRGASNKMLLEELALSLPS